MSQLIRSFFVGGLTVGLLGSGLLQAGPKPDSPSPFDKHIHELHAIHVLLAKANHDYKGHRGAAMKHVHATIKILAEGHEKHYKHHLGVPKPAAGELQVYSDAQLRAAATKVAVIQGTLVGNKDGRAVKGVNHLQNALGELQQALLVR